MQRVQSASRGQVVRFLVAGSMAIGTDFGVYYLLRQGLPADISKASSFICGGVVAYLLNNFWVFEQRQTSSSGAVRFVIANALLMGANVLTNGTMLRVWPAAVAAALVTATMVTSALSYAAFKFWVFRS